MNIVIKKKIIWHRKKYRRPGGSNPRMSCLESNTLTNSHSGSEVSGSKTSISTKDELTKAQNGMCMFC